MVRIGKGTAGCRNSAKGSQDGMKWRTLTDILRRSPSTQADNDAIGRGVWGRQGPLYHWPNRDEWWATRNTTPDIYTQKQNLSQWFQHKNCYRQLLHLLLFKMNENRSTCVGNLGCRSDQDRTRMDRFYLQRTWACSLQRDCPGHLQKFLNLGKSRIGPMTAT